MRKCENCGAEISESAAFCRKCGARVFKRCDLCGEKVAAESEYCIFCGAHFDVPKTEKTVQVEQAADGNSTDKLEYSPSGENGKRPLMYYMVSNKRLSRALLFVYFSFLLTEIGVLLCWLLHLALTITMVSPHWVVFAGACATVVAAAVGYILPVRNVSAYSLFSKVKRRHAADKLKVPFKRLIIPWLIIIAFAFAIYVLYSYPGLGIFFRGYMLAVLYFAVVSFIYIIGARVVASRNAAMAKYLWGYMSPSAKKTVVAENGENRGTVGYKEYVQAAFAVDYDEEREIAAYSEYKNTVSMMRGAKDDYSTVRRIRNRRILLSIMTALFVVVTAITVPLSAVFTDRFSANYANKSVLPFSEPFDKQLCFEYVQLLYGDYNFIKPYGETGCVVEYYSDEYLDLYEEYYELSKRAESDPSVATQIVELQLETAGTEYKYLAIYMDLGSEFDEDKVSYNYLKDECNISYARYNFIGMTLDTARCEMKADKTKRVKEKSVEVPDIKQNGDPTKTIAEIELWYEDGSYKYSSVNLPEFDTSKTGPQTVTLANEWGTYTITVNVL